MRKFQSITNEEVKKNLSVFYGYYLILLIVKLQQLFYQDHKSTTREFMSL